jgi:HPt (histidine-containing phosphotransfer) domain-containing protein
VTTAPLQEIKKELKSLDVDRVQELCMKLAKYKKENKELLNYLLFEAEHEQTYISNVKEEVDQLFKSIPSTNSTYLVKKSIRKILRFANKQIKYSDSKQTEVEIRIFFCLKMKERIDIRYSVTLFNLYQQQLKKIESALTKLPEDLQTDYQRDLTNITTY